MCKTRRTSTSGQTSVPFKKTYIHVVCFSSVDEPVWCIDAVGVSVVG